MSRLNAIKLFLSRFKKRTPFVRGEGKITITKSSGFIQIQLLSTTGFTAVRWWDGAVETFQNDTIGPNKTISGIYANSNPKTFSFWSCVAMGNPAPSGSITAIADYYFTSANMISADLRGLKGLQQFSWSDATLEEANISGLKNLISFGINQSAITKIHLLQNTNLQVFEATNSGLTGKLDVSNLKKLQRVSVDYCNNLTSVDISGCTGAYGGVLSLYLHDCPSLSSVRAVGGHIGGGLYNYGTAYSGYYSANIENTNIGSDALYDMIDQGLDDPNNGWIYIRGCPCSVGDALQDGTLHTAAEISALAATKNITLVIRIL